MRRKLVQFGSSGVGLGLSRREASIVGAVPGIPYRAAVTPGKVVLWIAPPATAEPLSRAGSRGLAATRNRSISGGPYFVLPPDVLATMGWARGTSVEVHLSPGSIEVVA